MATKEGRDALATEDNDWQQQRSHAIADSPSTWTDQQWNIQHLQQQREDEAAILHPHLIQDQFQPRSPHPLDVSSYSSITTTNDPSSQPCVDRHSCEEVEQSLTYEELALGDSGSPHTLMHCQQPTANNSKWHIQPMPHELSSTAAIVLGVKDSYTLPAMVPNTSVAMINQPHRVRAVCACIRCRKLKASCDNQRPCSRCVTSGHECIDRSEEEVKSGPTRKKRPPPSLADSTTSTTPMIAPAATSTSTSLVHPSPALRNCETQDPSSFSAWSRSFLNLLIQSGVRDSILKVQARFDTLPIELPNLLEWHIQVAFMCSHFVDQMTQEDFLQFLTHGLSDDILNSRLWSSSPFAPWTKLSTRPFFGVWQPLLPTDQTPPDHPSTLPSEVAELYIEFTPSSNVGYSRFLQMLTARIMYERELSNGRIRKQPCIQPVSSHPLTTKSHISSDSSSSSMSDTTTDNVSVNGDSEMNALSDSMSSFSLLDFSTALLSPPPSQLIPAEHERDIPHAAWCPMSRTSIDSSHDLSSASKLSRTNLSHSVHDSPPSNLDQIPLADLLASTNQCICSLSIPISAVIRVNPAFERLFGWRRIELEQLLPSGEGCAWFRHLMPPSSYMAHQAYSINHYKSQMIYIGEMAIQAAYLNQLKSQGQSPIDLPPIPPPDPWLPQTCRIRRKTGEIDPHVYVQCCRFQSSDGKRTPTTTKLSWKKVT